MEQHEAGAQHETGTTSWHSYPKVYALGHAAIRDLCRNREPSLDDGPDDDAGAVPW